jgi:hypothetical protein
MKTTFDNQMDFHVKVIQSWTKVVAPHQKLIFSIFIFMNTSSHTMIGANSYSPSFIFHVPMLHSDASIILLANDAPKRKFVTA